MGIPRHGRSMMPGLVTAVLLCVTLPGPSSAQTVETVGSRALGMGGAFVAVASDSSATWWNPGALAEGPFLDVAFGRGLAETGDEAPATRTSVSQFSIGTPPLGFSYYRLRITEIHPADPTAEAEGDREDEQSGIPLRSLSATQIGVTTLQTLVPGVHVGTTLKYVRGTLRTGMESASRASSDLFDRGDDLTGGNTQSRFDLDAGVLAVGGPLRVGAVVRNVRAIEFDGGGTRMRLPRQIRAGAAFDGATVGLPLTVAFDADLRRYATTFGDRRVLAFGAEHWLVKKRLAARGGARFNTVGMEERSATGGVSVGIRSGFFLEGHVVRGGNADERGWGVAARVSF